MENFVYVVKAKVYDKENSFNYWFIIGVFSTYEKATNFLEKYYNKIHLIDDNDNLNILFSLKTDTSHKILIEPVIEKRLMDSAVLENEVNLSKKG